DRKVCSLVERASGKLLQKDKVDFVQPGGWAFLYSCAYFLTITNPGLEDPEILSYTRNERGLILFRNMGM
ncbi:hypothetical protein, partial [Dehalobacter sp. TeCB1]|uniref:hypothetical protein n=1 Tax=Dehalobacter sp. TeCB1 TaxID=1843715 RepID=UPI001A9A67C9